MRKLRVSTLVTLDGVIQDPGGFGEIDRGGWANPYFTDDARQDAYQHLMESDYFLCGRVTYELMSKTWSQIKAGPYLERMNSIPKLVASRTLKEPLEWNATLIKGDLDFGAILAVTHGEKPSVMQIAPRISARM